MSAVLVRGPSVYDRELKVDGWRSGYVSVQRVLSRLSRKTRSEGSKREYCKVIYYLMKFAGKDPDELVGLEKDELEGIIQSFIDDYASRGHSVKNVNAFKSVLLVFAEENGFKHDKELEVQGYHVPPRYRKKPEYIPTKEEVYRMASGVGWKYRAIILCLLTSGLRNATLRALKYRDVKIDLESGSETIFVPVYPEMKEVDSYACKGSIPYYTFFASQAAEALRFYIEERKRRYGGIEDDELLFIAEANNIPKHLRVKRPISERYLDTIVKSAARKAGIEKWIHVYPHCLRKTFESIIRGEKLGGGRLDPKTQEFLMGHILPGSQDKYFGSGVEVNGSTVSFDKTKVEEIRAEYATLNWGVSTDVRLKHEAALEAIRRFAEAFGIDPMKVRIEKQTETKREITPEEEIEAIQNEIKKIRRQQTNSTNSKPYQSKIVTEDELVEAVEEGWEIVRELKNNKFLVRRANNIRM